MRYAVLSDVHGNLEALTAVLAVLRTEGIDHILSLGDVVGYGADPAACLAQLQASCAIMVAGNHEWGCIGKLELSWFHEVAQAALRWTRDQLTVSDLDLLRRLPLTTIIEPFTLVHGSLETPQRFDYLVDATRAIETIEICQTLFCLVGHTHVPCCVEYDRSRRRITKVLKSEEALSDARFQDDPKRFRYLVNPGSVGQPRDGDPRASFAMIDTVRKRIAVRRTSYDLGAAQQKICEAGLPTFLADRLARGQ